MPFPQAEQFLLIVVREFSHFILHVTQSFFLVIFVNNPTYLLCIFCFPLLFPRLQLPPLLWQLDVPMFLSVPLFSIVLFTLARACRCVPVHLLRNRTPDCRALVTVRSLALTNPGPPSSRVAKPRHAQIRYC